MHDVGFMFSGLFGAALQAPSTSTQFTLLTGGTQEGWQAQGSGFTYSGGFPSGGTITSLVYSINGVTEATITNASFSVSIIRNAVFSGLWTPFVDHVFGAADTITGSDDTMFGDVLVGWGGNDTINGGLGGDTLFGDSSGYPAYAGSAVGNDTLNGGAGQFARRGRARRRSRLRHAAHRPYRRVDAHFVRSDQPHGERRDVQRHDGSEC
jgi:hypothetical protein